MSCLLPTKSNLNLIAKLLRSGTMSHGMVSPTEEGTIQGSPLSPLLNNFVLDELDKRLEQRGFAYCRFADDCNAFVGSKKAADLRMACYQKEIETAGG